jgi:Zn-dependent M28 family amino/carboxypeptidase
MVLSMGCSNIKVVGCRETVNKANLVKHVESLINTPGFRTYDNIRSLNHAAIYIESKFDQIGLRVTRQEFEIRGNIYTNIIAGMGNHALPKIVIGAHYDVCGPQPGADDNASGVAGLIEIARVLKKEEKGLKYYLEFVAFSLEEPPFFGTDSMGSYFHARQCFENRDNIVCMISLEMLGYYSDEEHSQDYPVGLMKPFYPDKGDFIGAVGNFASRAPVKKFRKCFQKAVDFPCVTLAAPSFIPGVDFSDHRNYWKFGFKAFMITDTAFYRNRNYHRPEDTIETLDFDKMATVTQGIAAVLLSGAF